MSKTKTKQKKKKINLQWLKWPAHRKKKSFVSLVNLRTKTLACYINNIISILQFITKYSNDQNFFLTHCGLNRLISTLLNFLNKRATIVKCNLKGELRLKFHPCSYVRFLLVISRKSVSKVLWPLDRISRSYKVSKFCIQRMWRHTSECIKHVTPGFLCIFCYFYGKKVSYKKVLWCIWPFLTNLWSCKVFND